MSKRLLLAGLAAAAIALPAAAQQACLQPAEQTAFDVRSLQSQLMVAALTCQVDMPAHAQSYGQFLQRYDVQIRQAFRGMEGHYRRTVRGRHQAPMDSYVTTLANVQGQDGTRQGSYFCRNATSLFTQALAVQPDMNALAQVARNNGLSNPHGRGECGTTTPAAAGTTVQTASVTR